MCFLEKTRGAVSGNRGMHRSTTPQRSPSAPPRGSQNMYMSLLEMPHAEQYTHGTMRGPFSCGRGEPNRSIGRWSARPLEQGLRRVATATFLDGQGFAAGARRHCIPHRGDRQAHSPAVRDGNTGGHLDGLGHQRAVSESAAGADARPGKHLDADPL
eukprot:4168156-Prymnesium_polylepis.1